MVHLGKNKFTLKNITCNLFDWGMLFSTNFLIFDCVYILVEHIVYMTLVGGVCVALERVECEMGIDCFGSETL